MIPTHDPAKPWPTRTPLPTATPWLEAAVRLAAQRQAELASMRNAAQTPASLAGGHEDAGTKWHFHPDRVIADGR